MNFERFLRAFFNAFFSGSMPIAFTFGWFYFKYRTKTLVSHPTSKIVSFGFIAAARITRILNLLPQPTAMHVIS